MLALMVLVALGIVECACRHSTRRPGSGLTSAAHLLLLGAMVAMLVVPGQLIGISVVVGAVLLAAAADRLMRRNASPICGGQLIACSVSTLVLLAAMALVPAATAGHAAIDGSSGAAGSAGMAGMPTTGDMPVTGAGVTGHLPAATAAVVLVVFLVRAGIEAARAIRGRRGVGARPIGHVAAVAGALSMVVMCTVMVAL